MELFPELNGRWQSLVVEYMNAIKCSQCQNIAWRVDVNVEFYNRVSPNEDIRYYCTNCMSSCLLYRGTWGDNRKIVTHTNLYPNIEIDLDQYRRQYRQGINFGHHYHGMRTQPKSPTSNDHITIFMIVKWIFWRCVWLQIITVKDVYMRGCILQTRTYVHILTSDRIEYDKVFVPNPLNITKTITFTYDHQKNSHILCAHKRLLLNDYRKSFMSQK